MHNAHLAAHIGVLVGDRCLNLLGVLGANVCMGHHLHGSTAHAVLLHSTRCGPPSVRHQHSPVRPRTVQGAQPLQLPTGGGKPFCTACSEVVPTHQSKLCRLALSHLQLLEQRRLSRAFLLAAGRRLEVRLEPGPQLRRAA